MGKSKGAVDPTFERLNFLHQLSLQCSARLGGAAAPAMGRYYTYVMRGIAHRCVLRLGRNVKRWCGRCVILSCAFKCDTGAFVGVA
jgi:RNase P subunit RPR2